MIFSTASSLSSRKHADLLVLPFWKSKDDVKHAANFADLKAFTEVPIELKDFNGKEGEVLILYASKQKEPRIALLGLGEQEKLTVEKLRRAFSCLAKACRQKKLKTINLLLPEVPSLTEEAIVRGIVEGLLLTNYAFTKLKPNVVKDDPVVLLTNAVIIGASKKTIAVAEKYAEIAKSVYIARDLVNDNADEVTPAFFVKLAKKWAKELPHVKATIFNKERLEKEKMGLILAVSRSSQNEPALIILEYKGNPKSTENTVIVGKGVTYDTGGLNLKPTGSMETMKCDMGGAAAVLGTLHAVAKLGLKVNLTAVIPTVENCIGSASYKPGDVYTSYSGKTVEIGNTDAEGRLILADALAYTVKHLKPTRIIDFATLTGAIDVALGPEATGLMSNDDALADSLMRAGSETYERLCRLPLYDEYKDLLKSDVADMRNVAGRSGGSITAGLFLQEFVGKTPWAHCDIASTAFLSEARRYHPKHATGVGIRLMLEFLEQL